jgi:hypothetical protein
LVPLVESIGCVVCVLAESIGLHAIAPDTSEPPTSAEYFWVEWELSLTFEAQSLAITNASLRIVDLRMSESMPKSKRGMSSITLHHLDLLYHQRRC